jgi:hypothetical protein
MYYVYGDYGYESETLLNSFKTLSEAERFFTKYTRDDLGGYNVVEVASFADDGEYLVHDRRDSEMYGDDDYYYDDEHYDDEEREALGNPY